MARFQKLFQELTGSEFYRNIAGLFTGVFAARLIPALFALAIARLYLPENFGDFVLFLSIASLFSILVNGGYESALLLAGTPDEKKGIIRLASKTNLFVNLPVLLLIIIVLSILGSRVENPWLWLLIPFYAFFFGALQVIRNLFISNKEFRKQALLEIYRAIATGVLQTLLFFLPGTGLFVGVTLAQVITLAICWKELPENPRLAAYSSGEKELALRYRNFPLYNVPAEFFNYLSNQLPVFMIKPFFGQFLLGMYSFSHRYLNIPVQLTSISIGSVYIQKARSLHREPGELAAITWSLFKKQVWTAILPFTILALRGKEIFGFLFGTNWEFSGSLARILAPWLFMVFISSPLSTILIAKEKQKISMIFNILLLVTRAAALAVGGILLKEITLTVGLYSFTGFLFFTILGIYSLYLAGVDLLKAALFLVKVILICVIPLVLINMML